MFQSDFPTKGASMPEPAERLEVRLGLRLKQARTKHEMTQDFVAQRLGLPRQAISEIENGKRSVSADEVFSFSRLYGVPVEELLREEGAADHRDLVFLRADLLTDEGRIAISRFESLCREYRWLEEALGEVHPADLRPVAPSPNTFEDAWRLASEERKRLDLGATPVWSLLEALEERVGIKVFAFHADWSLSGACVVGSFGPAVYFNLAHPAPRRIYTLAHEYFHLLLSGPNGRLASAGGRICGTEPESKAREDKLADQFAAELLMPREAVEERLVDLRREAETLSGSDVIRLAVSFGVSTQAMLFRLGNLGKLGKATPQELYADPDLRQIDRESRMQVGEPPSTPRRFETLAILAFLAGHISRSKLAELLDVPLPKVETRVAPFREGDALSARIRHAG